MTKILNRYAVDPRDTVIDTDFLREISELTKDLTQDLRDDGPPKQTGVFEWDEDFVAKVQKEALAKVNEALEIANRRKATDVELSDATGELRAYIVSTLLAPRFDGELLLANNAELSPVLSLVNGNFFAVDRGVVAVPIIGAAADDRDEITTAAFYVDFIIEVVSLLTSAIGLKLSIPQGARVRLKDAIRKFLRTPEGKRAFRRLMKAIKDRDWELFFKIIDGTELGTLISEFFAHMFADMSWKDYFVTILQLLAFIAICAASGGAALAAKLAAVGLDLIGLGLKVKHAYEHGIK